MTDQTTAQPTFQPTFAEVESISEPGAFISFCRKFCIDFWFDEVSGSLMFKVGGSVGVGPKVTKAQAVNQAVKLMRWTKKQKKRDNDNLKGDYGQSTSHIRRERGF